MYWYRPRPAYRTVGDAVPRGPTHLGEGVVIVQRDTARLRRLLVLQQRVALALLRASEQGCGEGVLFPAV